MLMLDPLIGDGDFDPELVGDAVVQIQRIHLTDCSDLLVMAKHQLSIVELARGNNPVRATQQRPLRRIGIKRIHCEKTCRRDLLRRPDHDKTGDRSARCLRGLDAGPREKDCCKTENESEYESEYEPFPCHHDAGPSS